MIPYSFLQIYTHSSVYKYMNTYKSGYAIFAICYMSIDHCGDVKWRLRRPKLPVNRLFVQQFCSHWQQRNNKLKVHFTVPLKTHRWPVDTPPKGTTWKMFPFEDVIVYLLCTHVIHVNVTPVKNSMAKLNAVYICNYDIPSTPIVQQFTTCVGKWKSKLQLLTLKGITICYDNFHTSSPTIFFSNAASFMYSVRSTFIWTSKLG